MRTGVIFVSLPVMNLERSTTFYQALGFTRNDQFLGDTAACMVWSEAIQVILLTHDAWKSLTNRPIAPSTSSEVGLALSVDSREAVDAAHDAAVSNGGTPDVNPVEDYPFMYGRDFTDPDGHIWGAKWMDPAAFPAGA